MKMSKLLERICYVLVTGLVMLVVIIAIVPLCSKETNIIENNKPENWFQQRETYFSFYLKEGSKKLHIGSPFDKENDYNQKIEIYELDKDFNIVGDCLCSYTRKPGEYIEAVELNKDFLSGDYLLLIKWTALDDDGSQIGEVENLAVRLSVRKYYNGVSTDGKGIVDMKFEDTVLAKDYIEAIQDTSCDSCGQELESKDAYCSACGKKQ